MNCHFMFSFMCLSLSCRELLNQTYKERRVLLTRDVKLLKYQYLASNQVYRVKSLLKHDQLAEVCTFFFSVFSFIDLQKLKLL